MTRAVHINLKQRINSALNNEQIVISSKWITRTSLAATVTRVSNFVEENVCVCGVFLQRQGSRPGGFNHSMPNTTG